MRSAGVLPDGTALAFGAGVRRLLLALVAVLAGLAPPALATEAASGAAGAERAARADGAEGAERPAPPNVSFGWQPAARGRGSLTAVAIDPASGRVAIGDARGVSLFEPGGAPGASFSRPDVTALAFTAQGALLVGTAQGLFAYEGGSDLADRSPSAGDEARSIARIASCSGAVAVATGRGVHVSADGRLWHDAPGALGREPATSVTVRCRGGAAELRAIAGGDVWRATLRAGGGRIEGAAPVGNLDPGARARAVDVRLGDDGSEQVLTPDALASRENEAAPWRIVRPALAPGAVATRICAAAGRRWIATDRGLFAEEAEGAWVRLPPGAVFAAVTDVAGDASRVLAATQQGLLEGHVDATQRARAASLARSALALEFPGRREPAVQDIFAAALDHLSLRPEAMRSLRTGLSARGLFPKLELRVERGRARTTDVADDESFVSGDIRRLHDQNGRSAHDVTALVQLSWELGDLAYSPESVDLSKEARAVTQLRDDVLDEITQLYFERRRVLLELAELGAAQEGPDAARLRLRADELAAGLDAWTGGWFGRRVAALSR